MLDIEERQRIYWDVVDKAPNQQEEEDAWML